MSSDKQYLNVVHYQKDVVRSIIVFFYISLEIH